MSANNTDPLETYEELTAKLDADPGDWDTRKDLAHLLYNENRTKEAADLVWGAPEIPGIDLELGFAVKVLGKGRPSLAIRLLNEIQRLNQGKTAQNLGLANALLHHGMVMQAARFYGAAIELDPEIVNPDMEHFLLWIDDTEKLWGNFKEVRPTLEDLPWIKRDAEQAEFLKKSMKGHTTPISIPGLKRALAEEALHGMYIQSDHLGDEVSPPPAVTIPIDRVNPEHIIIDNERGAGRPMTAEEIRADAGSVSETTGVALPKIAQQITPPAPMLQPAASTVRSAQSAPVPLAVQAAQSAGAVPPPVRTVPLATPPPASGPPAPAPTVQIQQPGKTQLLADGKLRLPRRNP
ncbi:MAG: hypothetical protein O3A87_02205 [Verrucomicrobia bacterium]|nr:hypothetical protein [Verrucomicrobiota bacterium]